MTNKSQLLKLNINAEVYVKLKDDGYKVIAAYHKDKDWESHKKSADSLGYTKFALWFFMYLFSGEITYGFNKHFHNDILIKSDYLEPFLSES